MTVVGVCLSWRNCVFFAPLPPSLRTRWSMWEMRERDKQYDVRWADSILRLFTCETVEDFWENWSFIPSIRSVCRRLQPLPRCHAGWLLVPMGLCVTCKGTSLVRAVCRCRLHRIAWWAALATLSSSSTSGGVSPLLLGLGRIGCSVLGHASL